MGTLVLVRHGESRWNLSNRFTGWVDVPLSENGIREAGRVAAHCRKFAYDTAFVSALSRAQETLLIILARQGRTGIFQRPENSRHAGWIRKSNVCGPDDLPVHVSDALNERYYGELQGMEKRAAEKKYGEKKVLAWRRGYAARPPGGESLEETHARVHPYLVRKILPRVRRGEDILVVAHGNTLRAIIKHLEGVSDDDIAFIDLPEAMPLAYRHRHGRFTHVEGDYRFNRPLR